MTRANAAIAALALLALAACGGERAQPAPAASTAVRDAPAVDSSMMLISRGAAMAIGVEAAPGRADSILAEAGMTVEEYEQLMYRIAADSVLSRLFDEALQGR